MHRACLYFHGCHLQKHEIHRSPYMFSERVALGKGFVLGFFVCFPHTPELQYSCLLCFWLNMKVNCLPQEIFRFLLKSRTVLLILHSAVFKVILVVLNERGGLPFWNPTN